MRNLFFAMLVFWIVAIPIIFFIPIHWLFGQANMKGSSYFLQLDLCITGIFYFFITRGLFKFFDRLKNGNLFDKDTVGYLRNAGHWWIGLWLLQVFTFLTSTQVFFFPAAIIKTNTVDFSSLINGCIIIFAAWLLQEAQGLHEEQQLTV